MISILISTYNQNPTRLAEALSRQGQLLGHSFEIIIGNDYSDSKFMPVFSELESLPGLSCFHASENMGRSRIRNRLGKLAQNSLLLFIDGDAEVNSDDYLKKYIDSYSEGMVICGGTAYQKTPPDNPDEILRWKYGIEREAKSAEKRNENPYHSFSSFNFLVPSDVFSRIGFDESIKEYGHEDTILGIELEKNDIPVIHIDNQLIHTGLDSAESFIEKTRQGLRNLLSLEKNYDNRDRLYSHIRILKSNRKLRKTGLHYLFRLLNRLAGRQIQKRLKSRSPSIRLLDLYKLCLINDIKD